MPPQENNQALRQTGDPPRHKHEPETRLNYEPWTEVLPLRSYICIWRRLTQHLQQLVAFCFSKQGCRTARAASPVRRCCGCRWSWTGDWVPPKMKTCCLRKEHSSGWPSCNQTVRGCEAWAALLLPRPQHHSHWPCSLKDQAQQADCSSQRLQTGLHQ